VISWHKQNPTDWKQTWLEVEKKWAGDVGCPDGVFSAFNIDAKVNAAYVVMGLLYGEGDFTKTLEIATRTGQDADCNPSSAGGILGTIIGYKNIPAYWKLGLKEAEDIDFKYTTISLNKVYEIGFNQALQNIEKNGGTISGEQVTLPMQAPVAVRFEKSFDGHYPLIKMPVNWSDKKDEISFEFEGTGFVVRGDASPWESSSDYVFQTELYLDNELIEKPQLPVSFTTRRHEFCWKYQIPKGKHTVKLKILNPSSEHAIRSWEAIIYSDQPVDGITLNLEKAKGV
jgi:hypothetical protein